MEDFDSIISQSKTILIIASRPLDFDCLGSGLILKKYLEHLGKKVRLIYPQSFTKEEKEYYSFLPYFVEIEDQDTREVLSKKNFDSLIFVDGANFSQFYDSEKNEANSPDFTVYNQRINIDHHLYNLGELGTLTFHRPSASSTTEIVMTDFIPDAFIDKNIATLAYCGLMGDTGNFKYNFSPVSLVLASKLMEKGADYLVAIDRYFYGKSKTYIQMLDFAIDNTVYDDNLATTFILLPYQKLQKANIGSYELTELKRAVELDLARSVCGYPRTMMIYEKEAGKINIMARGSSLHNRISLPKLFGEISINSGGHFNASGLSIEGNFEKITQEVKTKLKRYLDELVSS